MKFEVNAKSIKDTRGDKTIEVILKTNFGTFIASSPNGKSRGKFESPPWKNSIEKDIKTINNLCGEIEFNNFNDLKNIEKVFRKKVGANTMIAIEYCFLKALSKKQKKEVWELINPNAKKIPMPVGNVIGGGAHSHGKKPDFQEFLSIPKTESFKQAVRTNKLVWKLCKKFLKAKRTNDENAWKTEATNEEVIFSLLEIKNLVDKNKNQIRLGIDVASSQFYKKNYNYKNLKATRSKKEQITFMSELSKDFFYLEDPFDENDFDGFAKLKKSAKGMVVGDDLTVTNLSRIKKAFKKRAIDAVIIKPNQNGSLIEVSEIVKYCKKNNIKMIFSHRSGETKENILADLAFGFSSDFIKTGVAGKGRKEKLNRLIKITRNIHN